MLADNKLKVFLELIKISGQEELIWMNGYLSGLLAKGEATAEEAAAPAKSAVSKITVLYGTETGNSKKLATVLAAKAKKSGINAKVVSMDQYRPNDLGKEEYLFSIISTHGEGEPPAAAKKFYDHLHTNGADLSRLKFGVLALGDTSYPLFCKTGEDVDAQLQKLGAERIVPLQKCDVDFAEDADAWFSNVLKVLSTGGSGPAPAPTPIPAKKAGGRKTYTGSILTNINLNDRGSNKETHHIEIGADGVDYLPGDSIGIIPENPLSTVQSIIALAGVQETDQVVFRNEETTVRELLQKKLNIFYLPERVVKKYAELIRQNIPATRMDLFDLLRIYPVDSAEHFREVLAAMEPITPRLYSISSSPEAHSGEVHITVAKNNFNINDEIKYGLTSDFLSQLAVDQDIHFYIHPNSQFRLPEEDKDVIMVGPGTGIAPFRSFLAQRDAQGAPGRNWLFFGEQHFLSDFLYQTEFQSWMETGVLTKMNVAFSRDRQEKVYVQHKMLAEGALLYNWLESGAYVYVCGTKDPMSIDVENALLRVIETFGNRSGEEALQYVDQMKEDGRYMKDVY